MNQTPNRPDLLQDVMERIEAARRGLTQTAEPFTLRELNHRPGGKATTIRQLLNHLWAAEVWLTARVTCALKGEPDLSREQAEAQIPDVLGVPVRGLLIHKKGLGEVDPDEDVQAILARFGAVRTRTREMLSALEPDDLYIQLTAPCEGDRTVRDLLNHIHWHEMIHIGAMLNIRDSLKTE
jgi:uncharacterized damage-inducible protein DinB